MNKQEIVQTKFQEFLAKLSNISFYVWVGTILAFSYNAMSGKPLLLDSVLLSTGNVILGIIAFIVYVVGYFVSKPRPKKKTNNILTTLGMFASGVVALLIVIASSSSSSSQVQGTTAQRTPTPTATSTPKAKTITKPAPQVPKIDCIGPDYKTLQTTEAECIQFRTDWGLSASPGTREAFLQNNTSQITSDKTYFCQISNGGYAYYTKDKAECDGIITTDNEYALKVEEDTAHFNNCMSNARTILDSCSASCEITFNHGYDACIWAYTVEYAGIEANTELYGECLDEISTSRASCNDICYSTDSSTISQCDPNQ